MKNDPLITQFTKLLQGNPSYSAYFSNVNLCLVVPSDTAMSAINLASLNADAFVKRHLFVSGTKCIVASWTTFIAYKTKTETVYGISSFNSFLYFSNLTGSPLVNGAKVLVQDQTITGIDQVYHIIDRALLDGSDTDFIRYLSTDSTLTTSLEMWNLLINADQLGQLNGISKFKSSFISFNKDSTGTMLVPINDAWNTLSVADLASLRSNITLLSNVLGRCYIPSRMILVNNVPISFNAGFTDKPTVNGDGNIDGKYYYDSQGGTMNVQSYLGGIVRPNIAIQGGVVHIINSPMFLLETRTSYLQRVSPAFITEISKDPYLSSLLEGNYAVLAADNNTMNMINQMDGLNKNLSLLNSFILTTAPFKDSNNIVYQTAGNVSVRVVVVGNRIYLDTLFSADERTYINRARIMTADHSVGRINISVVEGTIGVTIQSCAYILKKLERRSYASFVDSLPITLGLGSPYTLFVPSNQNLIAYVNSSPIFPNINNTTQSSTPANNIVTVPTITTISSTINGSTSSNVASGNVGSNSANGENIVNSQANIQYLLQRMIVANHLVLGTKGNGKFKAATMNYAASNEMLDMEITPVSTVSIGIFGVVNVMPSVDGGFYCYSNDSPLQERRNLIYPVDFLLTTPKDSALRVCVKTPCSGCFIKYLRSLVFVLSLLVYIFY